jgi:PiT family inorganic phosphate transporter
MFLFFLSSGMFLGWSLGANDAANVFGTAVGTRMLRFRTAAILCCLFVMLGAVVSGSGASDTLGKLGSVNAVAGAFVVAFAAASSVYLMLQARVPVSTSQAIVGAIVGWNLFSGTPTDNATLFKIVLTWGACPILAGIIAILSYKVASFFLLRCKVHMFKLDEMTRIGLILVGAFGSFALGANNIANVVGVFLPVSPFKDIDLFGHVPFSAAQQLFFLGSLAISVGVLTYSKRTMGTVGSGIFRLSPLMALVAVWAHSVVLFLFASQHLEQLLISVGLPSLPLVPVSSSQAIVGAVVGMGLLKGGHNIRWKTVGGIVGGWVITPIFACVISFVLLFVLQNVFMQTVYQAPGLAADTTGIESTLPARK